MPKQFLAVGDYLINPELLTFAVLEQGPAQPRLRLGFATRNAEQDGELRLTGDVAREVLRWLRLNSEFLTSAGGFGSTGIPDRPAYETDSRSVARNGNGAIRDGWGSLGAPRSEEPGRFLSRVGD
jgi:hypothetical protein